MDFDLDENYDVIIGSEFDEYDPTETNIQIFRNDDGQLKKYIEENLNLF